MIGAAVAILGVVGGLLAVIAAGRMVCGAQRRAAPGYFSDRYRAYMVSPAWRRKRAFILATTLHRDALLPWRRATHVDHLRYRRLGHELPVVDVVPLSASTHRAVTALRDAGLRWFVNAVLRTAHVMWFVSYAIAIAWIARRCLELWHS